jgi:AsmA-like C-terminal region
MRRKIFLIGGGCFALLFILLVAFAFLLPYLVNLESVREKIEALLFQQVGGKVAYQKIDLFYFPRPGVNALQVTVSLDEKVAGTAKSVRVYPEIIALFKGKLGIGRIQIESPNVTLWFPVERAEAKQRPEGTALKELEEIVARVAATVPRLKVVMKDGRLNLLKGSQTVFSFSDINANMSGQPREPKIEITCRSNLWERMSAEVTINPLDLNGQGRIKIASFRPHLLSGFLSADFPLKLTDSELNLNLNFETKGQEVFQAALEGTVSKLTFEEEHQEIAIRGKRFQGAFQIEGKKIDISLAELNLDYPRLILSGKFKTDREQSLLALEVQGREIDVTSTRSVTLKLTKKIPVMNTIFDIVREGRIPSIRFQSHGRTMSELDDTERFTIQGKILDAKISVPVGEPGGDREDFTLVKAAGEVVISRGILEGRNLKAQWKNQQLQEGKLRVGLEGEDAPLHVEIAVETDLSLLPPLLNRVIKDRTFLEEIARLRQMEGRAKGRLVLGESLKSIGVKVDAQEVNLVVRHDRIPYPVTIHGGAVLFEGETLRVRNLSGQIGASSFSSLTGGIGVGKEPSIEISSGNSVISLEEIYPWLSAYESVRGAIKDIQSAKGKVILSGMRLSGPLTKPDKWDFETAGELENLIVSTSFLPEPVAVSSGKFNLSPRIIKMADFETRFMSASLNLSGALYDYQRGFERAELSLSGRVTPKDVQWLSDTLGLEPKVQLRSSVGISRLELSWRKGADVSLRGDFAVQNGPEISLDVLRHSNGLKINNLVIRDSLSDASIKLDVKGRAIDLTFSGRLSEKTIGTVFTQFQSRDGWVRGDFQAHIDVDQPVVLVAHGKAELNHVSLPSEFGRFPEIDEASVNARGDRVTVERSNFMWGGKRLALSGDVSFSEKRILLNLDLFTESIDVKSDLNTVKEIFSREKKGGKDQGLQVQGTLRIKTKSLLYDRIAWMPFDAEVMFDPQGVEVVIREANLCGIATPGSVKTANQDFSLDLRPFSKSQELQSTFRCLLDQEMRVKGDFDLKGRIIAQGKPEDLIRSFKGNVELESRDGHFYYSKGLMRVLEFVNSTEIYRGKLPDPGKEGIDYKLIKIRAALNDGKLMIEEALLDGPALELVAKGEIDLMNQEINLMGLVAPLKTVDRIVKLTPVVREIFAGTLITVPVRVHGSLKDPRVTPLAPSAIGDELLAMMKRTLGLPFKVIEPFVPRKKEGTGKASAP